MKKCVSKLLLFIPLLTLLLNSCNYFSNKHSKEEMKFVIVDNSIFPIINFDISKEIKPSITQYGINFRVINLNSDSLNSDTIIFDRTDFELSNSDTIYVDRNYILTIDEEITLKQLEAYFHKHSFNSRNLREKIYWMSRIPRAKIKEHKNSYGDVEGCWLVTPEGEYIPPEYWSYSINTSNISDNKYNIYSNRCVIASMSINHSSFEFMLYTPQLNMFDMDPYSRYKIKLNTNQEGGKFRMPNGKQLLLLVEVKSRIAFNRWGSFKYYSDFSPFHITKLNEVQFPKEN